MPRRNRSSEQVPINIVSSDDEDNSQECKSKRSRSCEKPRVQTSRSSKEGAMSKKVYSTRSGTSRRGETSKDDLCSDTFDLCLRDIQTCVAEDKKNNYAYFDALWFDSYNKGNEADVLKWIKAEKIFSRQYVFIPIVRWGHWNLLVLCNFGKTKNLGTERGPRMLLLDSLKTPNVSSMRRDINRFVLDILRNEELKEPEQFIDRVPLELPKVPQQKGKDCGIYVLYFIYCFVINENLGKCSSKLDTLFDPKVLTKIDEIREKVHSLQEDRNSRASE